MKSSSKILLLLLLSLLIVIFTTGCNDDDESPYVDADDDDTGSSDDDDDDDTDADDDDDDDDYPPFAVIMDYVLAPGYAAPANPETGAETPDSNNKTPLYRFRRDSGDLAPMPVQSVLILIPGYAAGASDLFTAARDLVTLTEGNLEVWTFDRRTHLLEDQTGFNAAEAAKDPLLAGEYYFDHDPIGDKTYAGWLDPKSAETDMMSEWGLDVQMNDIQQIIDQVPQGDRQTTVFLGGHSRGARYAQMYAAYEFEDGHLGSDDLAGILLLDYSAALTAIDEETYLDEREQIRTGEMPRHEIGQLGTNTPYFVMFIQFLAMLSSDGFGGEDPELGPDGFWPDFGPFESVRGILTRGNDVSITNEATWGLVFDNDSTPFFNTFYGHMGCLTGGEVGHDFIGDYPSEDGATYTWADYDQCDPEELMDIQNFIKIIYEGPSDFTDWYFPTRLFIDDHAVGRLETEGTWAHDYFHFYTSQVDCAVYALEGRIVTGTGEYDLYKDALGPVRGQSADRDAVGFHVMPVPDWGHIEVLMVEPDRNPFYDDFIEWVNEWSSGLTSIPEFGDTPPSLY